MQTLFQITQIKRSATVGALEKLTHDPCKSPLRDGCSAQAAPRPHWAGCSQVPEGELAENTPSQDSSEIQIQ